MKRKHLIIFYILIIIFGFLLIKCFRYKEPKIITYHDYIVQAGDTIWSIAEKYPHKDIRELECLIRIANHTDPLIHPGDVLKIPIIKK